jgi:hypothetical protein
MNSYTNIIEALILLINCSEPKLRFVKRRIPIDFIDVSIKVELMDFPSQELCDNFTSLGRNDIDHGNNEFFTNNNEPNTLYLNYSSSKWCKISKD